MGNDGSGKTTVIREVNSFFEELGFDTFHKHEYEYMLIKYLFKLVGAKNLEKSRQAMIIEKNKSWIYQVWPLLVCLDIYLQFIYFKIFKKNTIIILDRYIYDHYMSFEYLENLNLFTKWLYLHFPKPDIFILLWVEPEIAYDRKKDTHAYEISFYQRQLLNYSKMGDRLGIPTINTNKNIEDTKKMVLNLFFKNKQFIKMFIEHCSKNRILPWVMEEYKLESTSAEFESIKHYLDNLETKVIKTLEFINSIPTDKLIFKTYKDLKWIPFNDIDLIVLEKDTGKFLDYIKNKNGKISSTEPEKFDCLVEGLLKIEPHKTVSWRGVNYIDPDFLWEHPLMVKMMGVPICIPNYEADLLIHVAQIIYENSFIRYNEYQYIHYLLSQNININLASEHADKYGWGKQFKNFISLINSGSKQHFPYFLPVIIILANYMSKIKYDIKMNRFNVIELKTYFRDICVFIFWRFRYRINGKIPFDTVSMDLIDYV